MGEVELAALWGQTGSTVENTGERAVVVSGRPQT